MKKKAERFEQREPKASPGLPLASSRSCSSPLSLLKTPPLLEPSQGHRGFAAPPHLSEKYRSELATTKAVPSDASRGWLWADEGL